jgi:hypothetical protein
MIDIATELFETSAKSCQATIYHFTKNNKWFIGKIYLLTTSNNYPTQATISAIRQIYDNIEIVNTSLFIVPDSSKISASTIWKYSLIIDTFRLLYISNSVLVNHDLSDLISEHSHLVSDNFEFMYLNGFREPIAIDTQDEEIKKYISAKSGYIEPDIYLIKSSSVPDRVFSRSSEIIEAARIIVFDTLTRNFNVSTKINAVRLHAIRTTLSYLSSPAAKIIKRSVYTAIPKSGDPKNKICDAPQTVRRIDPRYVLDPVKLDASSNDFLKIKQANLIDTIPNSDYDVACIIAFKDRHSILQLNVECLNNQTLKPAIVLVASNLADAEFAISLSKQHSNVFVTLFNNYPIGAKWQAGVDYARKLNVKGVIILGSDDLLSLGYIDACFTKIDKGKGSSGNGVDLVGSRAWYIYDTSHNLYYLQYTNLVPIFLGGGRMFSSHFLNSVNWVIFNRERPFHLDEYGYHAVKDFSNSIIELEKIHSIISIKGRWDMINTTDRILTASRRIALSNVTQNKESFFDTLKIPNIDDYLN